MATTWAKVYDSGVGLWSYFDCRRFAFHPDRDKCELRHTRRETRRAVAFDAIDTLMTDQCALARRLGELSAPRVTASAPPVSVARSQRKKPAR